MSDTTPLSELAKVGQLTLLRDVCGRVIIPQEVYNELMAATDPAIIAIQSENWIEVVSVSDTQRVLTLFATSVLDLGECAAISLAEELDADRLLLDDLAARREAQRRGLPVIGTLGILLIAKEQGLISSVKQVLDDLIAHGMRISQRLYQEVLAVVGE